MDNKGKMDKADGMWLFLIITYLILVITMHLT